MVVIYMPADLRPLTGGQTQVAVEATTVGEAVNAFDRQFPGVRDRLCQGTRLRTGLMVSVDTRFATQGLREVVSAGSEIHFLPAIGGG